MSVVTGSRGACSDLADGKGPQSSPSSLGGTAY
jgi:hypothetical protein